MDEIAADPQKGLDATFAAVPDLAKDPALQRADPGRDDRHLEEHADRRAARARSTRAGWQQSLDFMTTLGLVPNPVTVDQLVNELAAAVTAAGVMCPGRSTSPRRRRRAPAVPGHDPDRVELRGGPVAQR